MFDVAVYWKYLHCKKVIEIFERECDKEISAMGGIQEYHLGLKTSRDVYGLCNACASNCEDLNMVDLTEKAKCNATLTEELTLLILPLLSMSGRYASIKVPKGKSLFCQNSVPHNRRSMEYHMGECKSPLIHIYPPNIPKDKVIECVSVLWDALDYLVSMVKTPEVSRLAGMLTNLCVENNGTDTYALRVEMLGMMPGNRARRASIMVSFPITEDGKRVAVSEMADKLKDEYLRISYEENFLKSLKNAKSMPISYKTTDEWVNVVRSAKVVELTFGREYIDLSLLTPERVVGCMYAYNKALSEMEKLKLDVMCGLVKRFPGCSLNKAFLNELTKKLSAYSNYIRYGKYDCNNNEISNENNTTK